MGNLLYLLQKSVQLTGISDSQLFPLEPGSPDLQLALDIFNSVMDGSSSYPYAIRSTIMPGDSLTDLPFSNISYISYQTNNAKLSYLKWVNPKQFDEYSVLPSMQSTPEYYTFELATRTLRIFPNPVGSYQLNVGAFPYVQSDDLTYDFDAYFPPSFQQYIVYEVASQLVQFKNMDGMNWTPAKEAKRNELKKEMDSNKEMSLTPSPSSDFDLSSGGYGLEPAAFSFNNNGEVLDKLASNSTIQDGASNIGYYDSVTGTPTNVHDKILALSVSNVSISTQPYSVGIDMYSFPIPAGYSVDDMFSAVASEENIPGVSVKCVCDVGNAQWNVYVDPLPVSMEGFVTGMFTKKPG